jgi:hypothetical protein
VAGYTVFYGTSSGDESRQVDTTQTALTIETLTNGVRYYFVVKSYFLSSGSRIYSIRSNEVNGIPANRAPVITNPGAQTTKAGPFSLTVTASDPDGDTLTYTAVGLPVGLGINSSNGTIGGTAAAGTYSITVTVSDGALQASATFTLTATANRAPTLQAIADRENDLDDVVTLQPVGSDPDGDPLAYTATGLPPGLSLAPATGRITGMPTIIGVYAVSVTVSDGSLSASRSFAWTIVALPPPVPVSWWKFDEGAGTSAADAHGSRTGTLTNGATWTAGRFGHAVLLDGSNDYVALPTFDITGSSFTIATWVHVSSFATGDQRLLSKTSGTTDYWTLGTSGATLYFQVRTGTSTTTLTSTAAVPVATWVHAVATYDGAVMRLYLNGVPIASRTKTGTVATGASAPVNIGRSPAGTRHLSGAIDDLRIFARGLTASEIGILYKEPPSAPPSLSFTDDPLVPGNHAMRLVHIIELRTRIDTLRRLRGLGAATWTPIVAGSTVIRASHITELRAALAAVYAAAGRNAPAYTDAALVAGMGIRAAHIMELRAAVRALE